MEIKNLKEYCLNLECSLKHNDNSDINGLDLFSKFKILRKIIHVKNDTRTNILNYIIRLNSFPNTFRAYRIMLTIHVIVARAERKYSKLKLKSYIRSTISRQILNGLILLSIEIFFNRNRL